MIHVSHNELVSTARKAFEALGLRPGERDEAAGSIAWLELHDLGGLRELAKALDYLSNEARARLRETYRSGNLRVFSADGASVLCAGALAVDAGVALACRHGLATIRVEDCHNRALIVGYLARSAREGVSALAYWRNRAEPFHAHAVSLSAAAEFPTLRVYEPPHAAAEDQSLTLVMSEDFDVLPQLHDDVPLARVSRSVGANQMREARERALENGLEVDEALWAELKRLGARVLVDSNERSRRGGAGEGQ